MARAPKPVSPNAISFKQKGTLRCSRLSTPAQSSHPDKPTFNGLSAPSRPP